MRSTGENHGAFGHAHPPRGMSAQAVADYLDLPVDMVLAEVEAGRLPQATLPGGRFDRYLLDRELDRLSASAVPSAPQAFTAASPPLVPFLGQAPPATIARAPAFEVASLWAKGFGSLLARIPELPGRSVDAEKERNLPRSRESLMTDKDFQAWAETLGVFGRNLRDLLALWLESPSFASNRKASTVAEYRRIARLTVEQIGVLPLVLLDLRDAKAVISAWQGRVAEARGPRAADNGVAVLSACLTWATDQSTVPEISQNHVLGIERLHYVDRSEFVYSDKDIAALVARAPPAIGLAVTIASETALRLGNVLRVEWASYTGENITFELIKQRKNRPAVVLTIPVSAHLKATLDAYDGPRQGVIVKTFTGKQWDEHNFGRRFRDIRDSLGLSHLHFHDLRGTAISRFAELGRTVPEIAAFTGHSTDWVAKTLEKYLNRKGKLAQNVIRAVDASRASAKAA